MKTLQCATKVLLFCFQVKSNPNVILNLMSMSKQQLAGKPAKKTLTLDEKIKFLNFPPKNLKLGCRKLADIYKIGQTAAVNILKNEKEIRENTKCFVKNQRNVTAIASTTRYTRFYSNGTRDVVFLTSTQRVDGGMLKEEAIAVK